jgi:hypothetical protein
VGWLLSAWPEFESVRASPGSNGVLAHEFVDRNRGFMG